MRFSAIAALAAVADGQLYIVGGRTSLNSGVSYDPSTNSFTDLPSMGTGRRQFGLGLLGNQLCAVGGRGSAMTNDACECLDIATDGASWEAMPSLNTARSYHAVATVGNTMCAIGGGLESGAEIGNVECYTEGATAWTVAASLNVPRKNHAAVAMGTVIYVVHGGLQPGSAGVNPAASLEAIDISNPTATWEIKADAPVGQYDPGLATVGTRLFSVGGFQGSRNEVQIYESTTDSWSLGAPMPSPRYLLAANIVGNTLFALGGTTGGTANAVDTNNAYDIAADSWSTVAPMPTARLGHNVVAPPPGTDCAGSGPSPTAPIPARPLLIAAGPRPQHRMVVEPPAQPQLTAPTATGPA